MNVEHNSECEFVVKTDVKKRVWWDSMWTHQTLPRLGSVNEPAGERASILGIMQKFIPDPIVLFYDKPTLRIIQPGVILCIKRLATTSYRIVLTNDDL